MIHMTASEARNDFAGTVNRARGGDRVALGRHGEVVAAIVSAEDLALLEMIESRFGPRADEGHRSRVREAGRRMLETHRDSFRRLAE